MSNYDSKALEWQRQVEQVDQQDVIVLENVDRWPAYNKIIETHSLSINLCSRGYCRTKYDAKEGVFQQHDIAVLLPSHFIMCYESSPDYLCTTIFVSQRLNSQMMNAIGKNIIRYHKDLTCHLNEEQFHNMNFMTHVMKKMCASNKSHRSEYIHHLTSIIFLMIDDYWTEKDNLREKRSEEIFSKFYDLLLKHYKESREVSFYAAKLCLTQKYLSSVIHKTTGTKASEWITNYIVMQAKKLLMEHPRRNIQTISYQLGFNDQAAFTRYFKRATGENPTQFRENDVE